MSRFFRRLAEGVFDEADVVRRAHELADFVEAARDEYGIAAPIALGYSNNANSAAAMLLRRCARWCRCPIRCGPIWPADPCS
jgi:phospholipase/carboxylesterase